MFVIEIKQPNIPLNSRFQQQLFSYMRQLKLEYGILIGQGIQIFYDGDLAKQEDPILLETIKFTKDNEKGLKFVEIFAKENFNQESLRNFTLNGLKKLNRREEHKELTKKLLDENYQEKILNQDHFGNLCICNLYLNNTYILQMGYQKPCLKKVFAYLVDPI